MVDVGIHSGTFQTLLDEVKKKTVTHNGLVAKLSVKEGGDNSEAINSIREQNPSNDPELAKKNKAINEIQSKLDQLIASANKDAEKYLPQPLEEDKKSAVQEQVKNLQLEYKKMVAGIEQVAGMLGVDYSVIAPEIPSLQHMNGKRTGGVGEGRGAGIPKIRTKACYIDGVIAETKKPGKEGEMSSTLSSVATVLTKTHKGAKISASDLQAPYFEMAGTTDIDKLPNEVEFPFSFKFGEVTIHKTIKVIRA